VVVAKQRLVIQGEMQARVLAVCEVQLTVAWMDQPDGWA
jgi:hypothetical protein